MTAEDPIAALLARVASADRAAFRDLYAAASGKLFAVAYRILRDRSETEDAVQEVFTRIWLNARRFDASRARGMTWAIAITRNLAIDRLRARPAPGEGEDAMADIRDAGPGAETLLVAKGEARRISDCFDTLDTARAEAIRGAYLNGLSYEQLAVRHDVPLNTMRSWLRRGLMKLKECLDA